MTATLVPDDAWPALSHWFGLHPRDVVLSPEEGGLTYGQIEAYVTRLEDMPPLGASWAVLSEVK